MGRFLTFQSSFSSALARPVPMYPSHLLMPREQSSLGSILYHPSTLSEKSSIPAMATQFTQYTEFANQTATSGILVKTKQVMFRFSCSIVWTRSSEALCGHRFKFCDRFFFYRFPRATPHSANSDRLNRRRGFRAARKNYTSCHRSGLSDSDR